MKSVYILLTRSSSVLSRSINWMTGDAWTHVSLALDIRLERMYSFGRHNPHFPLPAGLVCESLQKGYFAIHNRMPCMLMRLWVEDTVYTELEHSLNQMLGEADRFRYNIFGLMLCRMEIAYTRETHFFCSQFVSKMLLESGALQLPKDISLMRPNDYVDIEGLEMIYEGKVDDCVNLIEDKWDVKGGAVFAGVGPQAI